MQLVAADGTVTIAIESLERGCGTIQLLGRELSIVILVKRP
jgi:hypothetical protein